MPPQIDLNTPLGRIGDAITKLEEAQRAVESAGAIRGSWMTEQETAARICNVIDAQLDQLRLLAKERLLRDWFDGKVG